jgi:purine-binding chemotaxis protein CheW
MNHDDPNAPLPRFGLARDLLGTGAPAPGLAPAEGAPEARMQIVSFFIGREKYGLGIERVREVNRLQDLTFVPNCPPYIKGVINLRGRIVPVIELALKLGLGRSEPDKDSRVVVVEFQGELLGLLADRVARVVQVPVSEIESPPGDGEEGQTACVTGMVEAEGEVIMLLDLDLALQRERSEQE